MAHHGYLEVVVDESVRMGVAFRCADCGEEYAIDWATEEDWLREYGVTTLGEYLDYLRADVEVFHGCGAPEPKADSADFGGGR